MDDVFGLGSWVGRKQAFAMLAGKCSAADAECLRRLRDEKKYKAVGMNWDEFCTRHIGMTRPTANKIIGLLEEFGPKYFELSAVVRITPEEYRRIAPAVTADGLAHGGRLLEIAVDNAAELSAAVSELQREAAPVEGERRPDDDAERALRRARKAMREALETYTRASSTELAAAERVALAGELREVSTAILALSQHQLQLAGRGLPA